MAEYIEREALLELYADAPDIKFGMLSVPIPIVRKNILDMPAADVAPVVRCGECDRRDKLADLTNDVLCPYMEAIMPKDAFCSYGERKDGDG